MLWSRFLKPLKTVNELGTTILLVEQNVQSSLELADRAYVIENGANVMDGSAQDMLHDDRLRAAYLGM